MKLAFITGITGQDGSYLAELLLEKGYKVFSIVRRTSLLFSHTRIEKIRDKLELRYGDMTDSAGLSNYIHTTLQTYPDFEIFEFYNLAAQSHVAISFEIPEYTADVDAIGVLRLLEIIRGLPESTRNKIRFYQAGTSEMFGAVKETPQNENTPFNPVSPYAVAKVYGHYITKVYREAYGIYAVNGILFNHESQRRVENFVTMKIVNGVKNILNGKQTCIELGNIDSQRDWGARQRLCIWHVVDVATGPSGRLCASFGENAYDSFVYRESVCVQGYNNRLEWPGTERGRKGRE